ncbi:conserved membrane hypothetical protein [Arthrobacter sp. 9V]|uniref:hypothetical protein n=1 Tax=Arthrobacter sp. 9V TaxID=2653132 RepID=UPI0012EF1681|nr:hypothetical protein [Arthrobacter sp. 9V]VXB67108.1 conserved membrane hypothetical protein [Arthrobacter sp. 9V]
MDFDQWLKVGGVLVGLSGATATVSLAMRSATNREAVAYRRADESLKLAKSLAETPLDPGDPDLVVKEDLRKELIGRAMYSANTYASSLKPVFTSYWQPTLFMILGIAWCVLVFFSPLGPLPQSDIVWMIPYVLLAAGVVLMATRWFTRVAEHKSNFQGLEQRRGQAAPAATQALQEESATATQPELVPAGSGTGETGAG